MLGCSTASFFGCFNTEDAIEQIARLGFSSCEVFFNTFSEYSAEFMNEVKSRIDKYELCVNSVHALPTEFEPQLFVGTDRQKRDAFEIFEKILFGAKLLGAKIYVMHGKAMIHKNEDPLKKVDEFADSMSEILRLGEKYGIDVTLENVHWAMANSPEFIRQMRKRNEDLHFTFDIKQAILSGYSIANYINAMEDRIYNVHLCDVNSRLQTCLPGTGSLDFDKLKRSLDMVKYQGDFIFEVYYKDVQDLDGFRQSIEFCRNIFG